MLTTIDDNLVCERLLGWNLIDRRQNLWRLPDGTTRQGTADLTNNEDVLQAIDGALSDAIDLELSEAAQSAALPRWPRDADVNGAVEVHGDWTANYHIECAIARAASRLIVKQRKTGN